MLTVLGIETSCDETAVAVVNDQRQILANLVLSQIDDHAQYGGIVPEIAARSHLHHLRDLVNKALVAADLSFADIDAIAATAGPGLIGGVMIGTMMAKSLAYALDKPFIAVNHLEGHALTVGLSHDVQPPYLLLLVSGGHTQLLTVPALGAYHLLGSTHDDAVGEAFDKVAKTLGLGYPGGPIIEKLAKNGDPNRYRLPVPLRGRDDCSFSLSGLKTAVITLCAQPGFDKDNPQDIADLCASFQQTITRHLIDRCSKAMRRCDDMHILVIAGGVSANQYIYGQLSDLCKREGWQCIAPPLNLCADNAAMIAWAGLQHYHQHHPSNLDFIPKARWPLEQCWSS